MHRQPARGFRHHQADLGLHGSVFLVRVEIGSFHDVVGLFEALFHVAGVDFHERVFAEHEGVSFRADLGRVRLQGFERVEHRFLLLDVHRDQIQRGAGGFFIRRRNRRDGLALVADVFFHQNRLVRDHAVDVVWHVPVGDHPGHAVQLFGPGSVYAF